MATTVIIFIILPTADFSTKNMFFILFLRFNFGFPLAFPETFEVVKFKPFYCIEINFRPLPGTSLNLFLIATRKTPEIQSEFFIIHQQSLLFNSGSGKTFISFDILFGVIMPYFEKNFHENDISFFIDITHYYSGTILDSSSGPKNTPNTQKQINVIIKKQVLLEYLEELSIKKLTKGFRMVGIIILTVFTTILVVLVIFVQSIIVKMHSKLLKLN